MHIAILGTGMVGRAIGGKLAALGHHVIMGTRDVETTMGTTENASHSAFQNWLSEQTNVEVATFKSAAESADILFNCTGGMVSLQVLEGIGAEVLGSKVLVDVANPLDFSHGMPPSLSVVNTTSLGEQLQAAFPEVRVVKTLNTMNAELMVNPAMLQGDHAVFVCGNDAAAKDETKALLASFGWKDAMMFDLGDISSARGTEMFLPLWLRLWGALGTAEFNIHIQKN